MVSYGRILEDMFMVVRYIPWDFKKKVTKFLTKTSSY